MKAKDFVIRLVCAAVVIGGIHAYRYYNTSHVDAAEMQVIRSNAANSNDKDLQQLDPSWLQVPASRVAFLNSETERLFTANTTQQEKDQRYKQIRVFYNLAYDDYIRGENKAATARTDGLTAVNTFLAKVGPDTTAGREVSSIIPKFTSVMDDVIAAGKQDAANGVR
ncbi:hypothetical protein EWD52_23420 [Salmonella enterica subsp. enterica serovar Braenderup]|nr:hypothetical protein [Salmonella enterica subsp. enterica serovar Braenderup]ECD1500249.1 hypothetical protein [Salmonella enterica subsp. enterica serovar Braenderup]